jgi:chromate reductase, NAD(P)H dehydrogenase (quinone)
MNTPINSEYLVISGTNRDGSNSMKIALQYKEYLEAYGIEASVTGLEEINFTNRNEQFIRFEREKLLPAKKYIIIAPEYNGSIPGVLKLMFDLADYKKVWKGKKALLVGISTGRSGNVRGLEHLTTILNYLMVVVHPFKLPISSVDKLINGHSALEDKGTILAIKEQLKDFIEF